MGQAMRTPVKRTWGERHTEPTAPHARFSWLAILPFVLSLIAGSTDTIGFLSLNGLFTAHITGNLIVLAAHLITGDMAVLSYLLAVPVFMFALLLSRLLATCLERSGTSALKPLLFSQFLFLVGFIGLCASEGSQLDPKSAVSITAGMFAVAAMAVQNALIQISCEDIPVTAVMTTNVTHLVLALGVLLCGGAERNIAAARRQIVHLLPVILGFTLGCALGAAAQSAYGSWSIAVPTCFALLTLLMALKSKKEEFSRADQQARS
jgi:uncharacterized membrane protein YoaK (UPF0700 family)